MGDDVTRGEFEMLRQIVNGNQARLESVNAIGVVQTQITEAARVAGRRWQIGTVIAALVLLVAILGLVINAHPLH